MKAEAYSAMRERESSYWWYRARREIICDLIRRYVRAPADVLDYGCGTGATAQQLANLGFNVTCVDISDEALGACREADLTTIDLRCQAPAPASADCVLACDVLEHIENDVHALTEIRAILRPEGHLIMTVPAFEFLWSGEDHVSEHFRRYTRRGLLQRLHGTGYSPVWCSYYSTLLFPLIATAILGARLFRPRSMYRSNLDLMTLSGGENELLYRIFAVERSLLRWTRLPVGSSLILVARR